MTHSLKKFFSSVQLLLVVIPAILLIGAMGASYVNPAKINILAFPGFAFPLLWVFNLAMAFWLIARKKWHFILPILALLITWNSWENVFQIKGKAAVPQLMTQPVKILTYNTRLFDFYKNSGLPGTPEVIFKAILNENADILCFQEYYTTLRKKEYTPNAIAARFRGYKYKHVEYLKTHKGNTGYGLAIFSKYPISNSNVIRFENSNNLSIYADLKIGDKTIRLFNNHLESIGFKEHELQVLDSLDFRMTHSQKQGLKNIFSKLNRAFLMRSKQAEALSRQVKNSPYPVIVCGDFNDTPVSYTYRKMKGNLKDAFRESGFGFSGTYNGQLPNFRIDYIFHAQEFTSAGYKRLRMDYSDHYPVVTTIDIGK
jgi:endonuclease/exonuclease/phosphatase family metal-dependent hydrolase